MRTLSDSEIKNYIEEYGFNKENIENIEIVTIVFEDGLMGTTIHINEVYIDCDEDILNVENDMVELQKEIKELGSFLYKEYGIKSKVEMVLFAGTIFENNKIC